MASTRKKHYSLSKQISQIDKDQTIKIDNVGSGRFQLYDSLPKVFQLYTTLVDTEHLSSFRFITRWQTMEDDEKRQHYSKHACHELNFFLANKDPEFFRTVIKPYLSHKLRRTFVDDYLLENELQRYHTPWHYARLNTVEKILLADRIAGESEQTRTFLNNQWQLVPQDITYLNRLFDSGIANESIRNDKLAGGRGGAQYFFSRKSANLGTLGGAKRRAGVVDRLAENSPRQETPGDDLATTGDAAVLDTFDTDFGISLGRRGRTLERLYRQLDRTKEWAENNYYRLPIEQQNADLVKVNQFWIDWANRDPDEPFRSEHFAQATRSFTEAMLALSVIDLPENAPEHQIKVVDQSLQINTTGPVVLMHEQVQTAELSDDAPPLLVSQNFFRLGEELHVVDGKTVDRFVTDEFLYQVVYGCRVVVTNPTSNTQSLDVLLQIPTGAIAVGNSKTTRSERLQLKPYHTQTLEYHFYFPIAGQFAHFPAHVTQGSTVVTSAPPTQLNVVRTLSKIDKTSWVYISQQGGNDDVLEFLKGENLQNIRLNRIAFRMSDAKFFREATNVLRSRHAYEHVLWSYALKHDRPREIREFLEHEDRIASQCGAVLQSPILDVDPVVRNRHQHLEYHPLVNARAHTVGNNRQILNDRLHQQYQSWLKLLTYLPKIDDQSRLVTVYYLLLQDRIAEAVDAFGKIDAEDVTARMQYDYCHAFLSMSQGDTVTARRIAGDYTKYPVDRWRNAFTLVNNHLDEIDGQSASSVDSDDRTQSQDEMAAAAPSYDFTVDGGKIRLRSRNLEQVQIRYYLMDIELLFSRNPFVQQHQGHFAYVAANQSETLTIAKGEEQLDHPLPSELANRNVLVEIEADGKRRSQPYYSNAITVELVEKFGHLRVTDAHTQKPLPIAYCKVYARLKDGSVTFFKDGYTDLRGRFDYASLSTNLLDRVDRMAILVLTEEQGATVKEVAPPKQ